MNRPISIFTATLVGLTLPSCTTFKRWGYEGWGRDSWQKPDEVVASLQIQPGQAVADLGSGGGYFTFRLSEAVGSNGKVYAVDIDEGLLEYVGERANDEGRTNVVPVHATFDDPGLADAAVDLLFTSNTYHHIENRTAYFARASRVLRPGGRVAIVDLDDRTWLMRLFGHTTPRDEIVREMEAAGYRLQTDHDFLPRQSFVVFVRTDG